MSTLKAWWKKTQWYFLAAVSVVAPIGLAIAYSMTRSKEKRAQLPLPPVPPALREKVEKAEEAALKAKVEATVRSEEQRKQLDEIGTIDDGAERRKRLASFLRDL